MILTKTKAFIRNSNKLKMRDKHFTKFIEALYCLSKSESLPPEFQDHQLCGDCSDFRECHISGDVVKLVRLGSHSQLFK